MATETTTTTTETPITINDVTQAAWVRVYTRPSTDVKWMWEETQYHWPYIHENYKDVGKLRTETEISEDGLTIAISFFFISDQAIDEWKNDVYIQDVSTFMNNYNAENGIERLL